jgi:hypothetical protein
VLFGGLIAFFCIDGLATECNVLQRIFSLAGAADNTLERAVSVGCPLS